MVTPKMLEAFFSIGATTTSVVGTRPPMACLRILVAVLAAVTIPSGCANPKREPGGDDKRESAKLIGSNVRGVIAASDLGADADGAKRSGVPVGKKLEECIVIDPGSIRDGLRVAIERDDHEITELRLSNQDVLAAECGAGRFALATWTSNRHTVVGEYHHLAGDAGWTEHGPSSGPACGVPPEVAELWEVPIGHCG